MRTALDSISRLPESARAEVSQAVADGKTWRTVAKLCEAHGLKGVTAQNVTNYRQSKAHKEWLARRDRIAAIKAEQAESAEIFEAAQSQGMNPAEAACAVAARKVLSAVGNLDLDDLLANSENPGKLAIEIIRASTALSEVLRKVKGPAREEAAKPARGNGGLSAEALKRIEEGAKLL